MITRPSVGKATALLALHSPGFVLPNAWDAGSARILERIGFPAIATTSAGIAWSCGVLDGGAPRSACTAIGATSPLAAIACSMCAGKR